MFNVKTLPQHPSHTIQNLKFKILEFKLIWCKITKLKLFFTRISEKFASYSQVMKRKAFLTFGVILVFAIVAIPRSIPDIGAQDFMEEVICVMERTVQKLLEHLRSFAFAALKKLEC